MEELPSLVYRTDVSVGHLVNSVFPKSERASTATEYGIRGQLRLYSSLRRVCGIRLRGCFHGSKRADIDDARYNSFLKMTGGKKALEVAREHSSLSEKIRKHSSVSEKESE